MKATRGILIFSMAMILCLGVVGTGIAAGGNGYSKGWEGGAERVSGTGICTASDIVAKEDVTIEGTVYSVGDYGQGISIDTGEEIVQVFGIGPVRYWEDVLAVERPDVGDVIKVTGQAVTFSDGTMKFIVFTVTFVELDPDDTIVLRDEESGLPLWRGDGFERQHRYMGRYRIGDDDSGL